MNVFLRIIMIAGILCLPVSLYAYQDRDFAVSQALDKVENSLNRVRVYEDVLTAESVYENSANDIQKDAIRLKRTNYSKDTDLSIDDSTFDYDKPFIGSFEFGTETFFHKFKEIGIMKQDGFLYGLNAAYTLRTAFGDRARSISKHFSDRDKLNMFRLEGMLAFGTVDFDSDNAGTHNGRENFTYEVRGLAGYDLQASDDLVFTPYMGIGYRYLRDRSPGRILPFSSFSGVFSFKRESKYLYVPFGLITSKKLSKGWEMDLTMEYDLLLKGDQNNHYNDGGLKVINTQGDIFVLDAKEYEQDKGFGLRGSARVTNKNEKRHYFIEPYVRYWKLRDSATEPYTSGGGSIYWYGGGGTILREGNQPKNETFEAGVKMGLQY